MCSSDLVMMVCAEVMGQDVSVGIAGQSGSFQLNVMLPLIARNLVLGSERLAAACRVLADKAIAGLEFNQAAVEAALSRNPILVTALNPVIGYELGAAIAKRAYAENRPLIDVAREMTELPEATLRALLDPSALTEGGIRAGLSLGG